jgi:hypothetical protein
MIGLKEREMKKKRGGKGVVFEDTCNKTATKNRPTVT